MLVAAALLAAVQAVASERPGWGAAFEDDYENSAKAWKEIQAQLPSYPKADNLFSFEVSRRLTNQYFVDLPSISVGEDGVVRYTVVVRSSQGAETVSFEGIRCSTAEKKLYAFGHPDGTWSKARDPKWVPIKSVAQGLHQHALYRDYFCPGLSIVDSPKEAIDAMKRGWHPRARWESPGGP